MKADYPVQSFGQNPGKLDTFVTLRCPLSSKDSRGAVIQEWVDVAGVYAAYVPMERPQLKQATDLNGPLVANFRIRFRTDVLAGWQVVMGEQVFEILAPPAEVPRRQFVDLLCQVLLVGNKEIPLQIVLNGDTKFDYINLGDGATPWELGQLFDTGDDIFSLDGGETLDLGDGISLMALGVAA